MSVDQDHDNSHIHNELGFAMRFVDDELVGTASVIPELWAPDSPHLRTSVLATWVDHLAGLLAALAVAPRVAVTLDLDVHLYRPAPRSGNVVGKGAVLKNGRSVTVAGVEFASDDGEPIAFGTASFMASPDPALTAPMDLGRDIPPPRQTLSMPLAQRAACELREPGVAVLPRREDGVNSSNTVNGGLIALTVEEAALSLSPGATLCSLALRYMQPVRIGPVVATAKVRSGLGQVEVRDAGSDHRLSCIATTRIF